MIDLSHIIHADIPRWPGDPPVEFEDCAEIANDGFYLRQFCLGEHSATHINTPSSFDPNGVGPEAYAAESLVVPAIVIDIRAQAAADADYALTLNDVQQWEATHGQIQAGTVVLLWTGWQAKWANPAAFLNRDAEGTLHFPGFGAATTRFLVQHRSIAGVGIDTHGVDPGVDQTFATNRQVLERQGIVLENLTNLDQVPPQGAILVIGILRLQSGSGSPASVLAFVP